MTTDQSAGAVSNPPAGIPRILPHLIYDDYDDVGAAVARLGTLFGFEERTFARHTSPDGTVARDRRYQASDAEGHQWTFAQHVFDLDPEDHLETHRRL